MKKILALACLIGLPLAAHADNAPAPQREWTFLLYLNGNNNLDTFGKLNINQMEAVGSTDQVNLVTQWASLENGDVRRILVQKDTDTVNVTSPVLQNMGSVDMGSDKTLEDFIHWGITAYPAKHYFVAVWDHGSGWHARINDIAAGVAHPTDISWDDNTGHSITTKQLGAVMNRVSAWLGRKIDIYGSDACLMGMAEVAAEMKDSVAYFVGSQEVEPGAGWPYTEFLAPLAANPLMSAKDFTATLATTYAASYNGGSNGNSGATMSSYDMSHYSAVRDAANKLAGQIEKMSAASKAKVLKAAQASQSFEFSDYVDYGDFLKQLGTLGNRELDQTVITEANAALKDFVIISANTPTYAAATGMSIWIPKDKGSLSSYLATYKTMVWDTETHWSTALSAFVK
jgi:hypothetical protein